MYGLTTVCGMGLGFAGFVLFASELDLILGAVAIGAGALLVVFGALGSMFGDDR